MAITPSSAVVKARGRRISRVKKNKAAMDIYIDQVLRFVQLPIQKRVALATEYLHSTILKNISISVGRDISPVTGRVIVTQRSVKGEYPRADTTQLMKTLLRQTVEESPGVYVGYVGTPLDYGLILETNIDLDRRFLSRTLQEEYATIVAIVGGGNEGANIILT